MRNFEIWAIFESVDEPWFVGARVATTVTILKRQMFVEKRKSNQVRFIQLRKPIRELLSHDGTSSGGIVAADRFRDEILAFRCNETNDRYRIRVMDQNNLWNSGVRLGIIMGKSEGTSYDESEIGRAGRWR